MDYLGLNKSSLEKTETGLNTLLANYNVYYQNLRNFHWNVNGEHFFELHRLFEELYLDARGKIDEIAERILTLKFRPYSRMADYLDQADIAEAGVVTGDDEMIRMTLENHKALIYNMRIVIEEAANAGDEGTVDMISGFLSDLEKRSWMLNAWLKNKVAMKTAL